MADPLAAFLRRGLRHTVRRGLRGVWLAGDPPAGPYVWAANHHSWWDPFVAAAVLGHAACLVMSRENLARYAFLRRLGVFGTHEPRTGLRYLREGRVLACYPEGELRAAGVPGRLADGAGWFAARAGVPLCAVAVRVAVRGHQAPEAYVRLAGIAPAPTVAGTTHRLAGELAAMLSTMDRMVAAGDPRRPLPGFRPVVTGRRSWDEHIDALVARSRPWRR
jgi:1-acyl-sn-glycerol-3-phosphate acyltransferase